MFQFFKRPANSNNDAFRAALCPNPSVVWLQIGRIYLVVLLGIGLLITFGLQVYNFFDDALSRRTLQSLFYYFSSPSYPVAIEFLFTLFCVFLAERYWKRIEVSRFAALSNHARLFTEKRPEENVESFSLPATITIRYRNTFVLLMEGIALLLIFLFLGLEYLFNSMFFTSLLSWPMNLIMMVILIGCLVFLGVTILRTSHVIDVTDEGIRMSRNENSVAFIAWHEARLFACYRTWGARKTGDALICELSSSSAIVRWTWVQHPNSLWCSQKPMLPINEYQRQMQALVVLIIQKTGLPFYDLS